MIIIRMSGGLGNQMFQYALYLQLRALGREVRIDDTTEYTETTSDGTVRERRPRMLGTAFGITYPQASQTDIIAITDAAPGLAAKVRRKVCGRQSQEIRDKDFVYDTRFLSADSGYYCGCFQSARYFAGAESAVRGAYTFTDAVVREVQQDPVTAAALASIEAVNDGTAAARNVTASDGVSAADGVSDLGTSSCAEQDVAVRDRAAAGRNCAVHLRFGDYLSNPGKYGGICTDAYYDTAMRWVAAQYPDVTFYVFSNDAAAAEAWAADKPYRMYIVRGSDEDHGYRDLYLMSRCQDYIIANSSFSWWGAWLGQAPDKHVIAPSYWVREQDGTQLQRQDIFTQDMIHVNPDGILLQKADMRIERTERPLVSVIVAAYNIAQYLPRALDSLIGQTLQDLEIVVVDDGSTDETPQIADAYAQRDSRIVVLHKENGGLSDARNAGLAIARGQYIGFVDGDDWCEPAMYESMVQGCLRSGAPMACVKYQNVTDTGETATGERNQTLFTVAAAAGANDTADAAPDSADSTDNTNGTSTDAEHQSHVTVEEALAQSIILTQEQALDVYVSNGLNGNETRVIIFNSVWSKLFRRDLIEGLSFPKGKNSEDIMWTTRCLCKAPSVCYLPIRFYNYLTDRKDSIMNVQRGERRLNDEIPFWLEHIECLREKGFGDAAEKAEYYFYRRMLFYAADFHAREGMESYARDIERMMKGHEDRILKVMSHASYGSKGDLARMKLFLKNPAEYYTMAGLYEKTVVAIRNIH